MEVAQFISLVAAGVLTGNELGTWAVVHPAIQRLPFDHEVRAEQEITRRYGYFMPGLMLVTIISGFIAAGSQPSDAATSVLTLAGSTCFALMLAVTLVGNVPINNRSLRFKGGTAEEWRALRRRWDRLHTLRVLLDVAGLTCIALAALA